MKNLPFTSISDAYRSMCCNEAVSKSSQQPTEEGLFYNNTFTPISKMPYGTSYRHVFDSLKYNGNNVRDAIHRLKEHIEFMDDVATPEQKKQYVEELSMLRSDKNIKALVKTEVPKHQKSSPLERELSRDEWEALKNEFGITANPLHVGYIIPDGSCLNFCGGGYQRDIDHREVNRVIDRSPRKNTQYPEFVDVILSGAIRVLQPHTFMFGRKPTAEQWDSIYDIVYGTRHDDEPITIDMCKDGDLDDTVSCDYDHRTSVGRLKADVIDFFDKGIYPGEDDDANETNESFMSPHSFGQTSSNTSVQKESSNVEALKDYISSMSSQRSINVFLGYDIMNLITYLRGKFHLDLLGNGSSRLVFLADNGHVVKIAYNKNGIMQNNAEAHDYRVKNTYDCFSKIYWKSQNGLMIECERCDKVDSYSDFEKVTGIDFMDYLGFLDFSSRIRKGTKDGGFEDDGSGIIEYESMKEEYERAAAVLYSPRNANRASMKVLRNLADYVVNRTSSRESFLMDLMPQNWGIATRDGEKVVVLIDSGGTDSVIERM